MWDAFQREVLVAMGHTLLVPVAAAPPAHGPVATPVAEPAPPPRRAAVATGAPQPPLLHALALAAGVDPDQIAHRVALPPLDALRAPAAKRGLWPQLRRLRGGPRA